MAQQTRFIWNRRAFRQKMKFMSEAFIRGETEVMNEIAGTLVEGYEKIVDNWSAGSRPGFFKVVRYDKGTRRFHMRIAMSGSGFKKNRFIAIDEGLNRSRTVKTNRGFVTTTPNKVKISGLKKMYSPFVDLSGVRQRIRGQKESQREYDSYVKKLIKEHTTLIGPATQMKSNLTGVGHDTRMPMRPYSAKTTISGGTGGSGKYLPGATTPWSPSRGTQPGWGAIPYRYEITLGDIRARNWTVGLKFLMKDGVDQFGASQIWPVREFAFYVRRGYDRGRRYAKAR